MCHLKPMDRASRIPAPQTCRPIETELSHSYLQERQGPPFPGRNHRSIEFQEPIWSPPGHSSPPIIPAEEASRRTRTSGNPCPDHDWSTADAGTSVSECFASPRTSGLPDSTFSGHAQASGNYYSSSQNAKISNDQPHRVQSRGLLSLSSLQVGSPVLPGIAQAQARVECACRGQVDQEAKCPCGSAHSCAESVQTPGSRPPWRLLKWDPSHVLETPSAIVERALWNPFVVVELVIVSVFFYILWYRSPPPQIGFDNNSIPLFIFLILVVSSSDISLRLSFITTVLRLFWEASGNFPFVRFLWRLGFREPSPPPESLVHSDFKAVAKPYRPKPRSPFNSCSSTSQYPVRLSLLFLRSACRVFWRDMFPRGPLCFLVEFLCSLVLVVPSLCSAHKFPLLPIATPTPSPLPSCLLCDHTCLVLWCLYVVSFSFCPFA